MNIVSYPTIRSPILANQNLQSVYIRSGYLYILGQRKTCHSNYPYFQQLVQEVEAAMLEADSQLAVYLAYETPELLDIYNSVRAASDTHTASSAAAGQSLPSKTILFIVIKESLQKQCIISNFLTQWTVSCASFAALVSSLSTDGYQMVVGGSQSKLIPDMTLTNIQVSSLLSGWHVSSFHTSGCVFTQWQFLLQFYNYSMGCIQSNLDLMNL